LPHFIHIVSQVAKVQKESVNHNYVFYY